MARFSQPLICTLACLCDSHTRPVYELKIPAMSPHFRHSGTLLHPITQYQTAMDLRLDNNRLPAARNAAQLSTGRLAPMAAERHVARQQEYRGGWPLGYMGAECPADTPSKCTVRYGFNLNCCPTGQTCQDDVLSIYCCPTEADCKAAVLNRPVCANSSWDMYSLAKNEYFCCPTGYFGVLPISGSSGLCELDVNGLSASRIASLVTTPTGSGSGGGASTTRSAGNGAVGGGDSGSSGGNGGNGSGRDGSSDGSNGVGKAPGTSPNGISAGAIAGIAIGGVILLAICFAVILWIHRKSLRKTPSSKPEPAYDQEFAIHAQHQPAAATPETTAMPPPQYSRSPGQPELGGTQMVEMPTNRS
ncbi:hypothetical protein B0T18DRAFT_172698 [Schizothecium vesticola]|uniref:Uncharacterized protein n=1 Tax=Schizothecium vesticola TaxID=314040 RepID=A0AA40EP68_9PEZI|nr:hypothetical protein B0T18DRAFT_172698 [Schizothecium vesticola]